MSPNNTHAIRGVPLDGAPWWAFALSASAATAWLTMQSLQLGCTLVIVVLTVGVYVRSRSAGLVAVWLVWLVAPGVRRLFGLTGPYLNADPLALAPFLVTGAVAALELSRTQLSPFARRVLIAGGAGYLIGVPAGLEAPQATLFALFAYGVAVACFALGYAEPLRLERLSLRRVLIVGAPILAGYGIGQYVFPLPAWDALWLSNIEGDLASIGSPEEGKIRVFASLNSPGTLSAVLGLAAVCFFAARRLNPIMLGGLLLVLAAMGLTYARSAWVALAVAVAAIVLSTRGRAGWRLIVVIVIVAGGVMALAGRSATGDAVVGRFETFSSLEGDTSAQARIATPREVVPQAIAAPFGAGVGQAGEASRLGTAGALRNTDNGYLSLLYQVGPFGFLLVLGAALASAHRAWRSVRAHADPLNVLVVGLLAFLLVAMFTGDILYGVTGMAFWYVLGIGARRYESAHETRPVGPR